MGAPTGVLGIVWGSDARRVFASLSVSEQDWKPWEGNSGFVTLTGGADALRAFGAPASLRVIAADRRFEFEGAELTFRECTSRWSTLRAAVVAEYELERSDDDDLYQGWSSGELVRFVKDATDDTCRLTVAGPSLGPVYARHVLKSGFAGLARGLRP